MDTTILLVVFLPFVVSAFPAFWPAHKKKSLAWFSLLVPITVFSLLVPLVKEVNGGKQILVDIPWIPAIGVNFQFLIDGLGLLFALIISGIGILVFFYSIFYLHHHENFHRYFFALLMFMGSMLGVVFSRNLIVLFVFWELTSLSSFFLIGYWFDRKDSRYGALKALFVTGSGGLVMLAGFVLLAMVAGGDTPDGKLCFDLQTIFANVSNNPSLIENSPYFTAMLICILIGAFAKSAQIPFYNWLPDAMAAPTPISTYLHSSTMVKAGIFLIARLFPIFGHTDLWFNLVGGAGTLTMVICAYMALKCYDLKRILAFSTVSTLGLITASYGYAHHVGGTFISSLHILNHAVYKACLFMLVGIIDHATGTRDIRELGSLRKHMPFTCIVTCVASLSMAGIPFPFPIMGFLSKEFLLDHAFELYHHNPALWLFPVAAFATAFFTVGYTLKIVIPLLFGKPGKGTEHCHGEASFFFILPSTLLAIIAVVGGICAWLPDKFLSFLYLPMPGYLVEALPEGVKEVTTIHTSVAFWHGFFALAMTTIVVVVGSIIYRLLPKCTGFFEKGISPTDWPDKVYDFWFKGTIDGSLWLTRHTQDGNLRHYVYLLFTAIVILVSGAYLWGGGSFTIPIDEMPGPWAMFLGFVAIVNILLVLFYPHRLAKIIFLGVVGYCICIFFFMYRAPDLALTQLLVESIGLLLLLLLLYRLPHFTRETEPLGRRCADGILAISVGLLMFFLTYSAISHPLFKDTIYQVNLTPYFIEHTLPTAPGHNAGGHNVVNTILVDFRGFDTLGEITVLCLAAMGVYSLLKIRRKGEEL